MKVLVNMMHKLTFR